MLACSDVSKDGSKLLLTMAPNSQPDIYIFSNGQKKRITKFSGIDVGGNVKKIVHHGKNNSSCDSYGNQVVYSSKESRKSFNIYLTDSDGSQTRPLTSGGINQFPRLKELKMETL